MVPEAREPSRAGGAAKGLLRVLYFVAVLAVSLLLVYLLISWLEALDDSSLEGARTPSTWEAT